MPKKRFTAVVTLLSTSADVLPSSEANSPPAGSGGMVPPVPVVPPRPAAPVVPPRPADPVMPPDPFVPAAPGPVSPPAPVVPAVPVSPRSAASQHDGTATAVAAQIASDASVRGQ